jgi:hypothetical protein
MKYKLIDIGQTNIENSVVLKNSVI